MNARLSPDATIDTTMLTRRSLLNASAGLAATTLATAQTPPAREDSPIGKLKSRRAEAKPITNEERSARVERAQRIMAENKLNAIVVIGGTSLQYFSNVNWGNSERLFAMVLPVRGEPFFVAPAFEKDRAVEQIGQGPFGKSPHVFTWEENESPYQVVAFALKERGLASGNIGVEERVTFVFADGITRGLPAAKLTSATAVTAGCRMIKSPAEIALMRLANQVTLEAYEAAWKSMREGMTQHEFAGLVSAAHQKLGFQGGAGVQVGEFSALPHGSVKPQAIREGTILLIDGGCTVEHYQSDISRTFVLGKPTDKMKRVFDIVHQAQSAALAAARPGVACDAVDAAARKVIVDAGYGPAFKYFTHRVGHGIGMDGHEWPYLIATNTLQSSGKSIALEPQMTFSDEPGVYIPGEFGVRLEDDMHILDSSAELFTPQSPSLEDPFGKA
jgi:Xaa-Pro dipeptidase